jgi:ClpP class serine protease
MKFNIPDIVTALCSEPLMILSGHIEPFIATCVLSDTKFVENLSSKTDLQNTAKTLNVVNVQSVLSNNSNTDKGLFGYKDIAKALSLGNDDPSVAAHVMYIKSPGGSVTGLAELADLIHASPKPVYAYIDELGASAAYYIAAAATEIWTSTRSSLIGNIGSVIRTIDLNGILEKLGAKSIEVYGTDATNKDLGFTDAKNGNPEKLRKLLVDPANDMFTQDLKKYRPSLVRRFECGLSLDTKSFSAMSVKIRSL